MDVKRILELADCYVGWMNDSHREDWEAAPLYRCTRSCWRFRRHDRPLRGVRAAGELPPAPEL